jgi:hypothetical protein
MSIHKLMRLGEAKICSVCDQAITDDYDDVLITTPGRKLKVRLCVDCLEDFYRQHLEPPP